ncbi:MAG: DUF1493 family protein [Aureispira sp.]
MIQKGKLSYEEALTKVIHFFEQKLRLTVKETTSINYDLQLTGIDDVEALLCFEDYFGLSLEQMDSERYYWATEGFFFFGNNPSYYTPEKGLPLTISHLALVVQAGYWFEIPLMYCYPFIQLTKPIKNR